MGCQISPIFVRTLISGIRNDLSSHATHMLPRHPPRTHIHNAQSAKDTAGPGWFDLPATELTEELKQDFRLLRNRAYLDPKHFYKREREHKFPKYFHIGQFIQDSDDHRVSNAPTSAGAGGKVGKSQSLVEHVLQDAQAQQYLKRRFSEVQATTAPKRKPSNKAGGKGGAQKKPRNRR